MDTPTAADIRGWAPRAFDWDAFGYPAPVPPADDPLATPVRWSVGYVVGMTGRPLDTLEQIDASFPAIAEQAITLRTMQLVAAGGEQSLEAQFDAPWLKSFTAGSYSQTRFSPAELATVKAVNALPQLAELLWLLMTPEKRAEWEERLGGERRPAALIAPFDPLGVGSDWGELA